MIRSKTVVILTGPTAVGKTAVSIDIARQLGTEIISADSRQFYHELSIGTAKPTAGELAEVKHHFVGHLSVSDYYNVSRFEQDALKLLHELFQKYDAVVLTGGSGMYLDAVCYGIDDFPDPPPGLRNQLQILCKEQGIGALQELLQKHDPDYYRQVDLQNPVRLQRALEVCLTTGKPFSEQRLNNPQARDFKTVKYVLNRKREELFDRINQRVDGMMRQGLLEEVKRLLPYRSENALKTVGYAELFDYLDGKLSLEQAVEDIKTHTRRYAKRQLTWFKRDDSYRWIDLPDDESLSGILRDIQP